MIWEQRGIVGTEVADGPLALDAGRLLSDSWVWEINQKENEVNRHKIKFRRYSMCDQDKLALLEQKKEEQKAAREEYQKESGSLQEKVMSLIKKETKDYKSDAKRLSIITWALTSVIAENVVEIHRIEDTTFKDDEYTRNVRSSLDSKLNVARGYII